MTIKDRILTFLKEEGISREDFYRGTELSASNFKGAALKSELGGEKIVKILTTYKLLSPEWLLTGEGSMLRADSIQQPAGPASASASSDAVVLRLMDKLDDKETKIDHLQSELRAKSEELAVLKAKYAQSDVIPIAFTPGSPEAYTESCSRTKMDTVSSGRLLGGKM